MRIFEHVCVFVLLFLIRFGLSDESEEEFMYMPIHSFQSPYLFGMSHNIPFWEFGDSAVATEDYVRLAPNAQSKNGWMWNTHPISMDNWQVLLDFHIHNTQSPGADGLAFWITKEGKNIPERGPLYGYIGTFTGLGIIFDTYDNNHNGDNPAVILIKNEGVYTDWDIDNDLISNELGRCLSHYRNPINDKTTVKIRYINGVLSVSMDTYARGEFRDCFEVEVKIPQGYYFGMTAATGGLTDNHDLLGMYTRQILNVDSSAKTNTQEQQEQDDSRKGWYDPYRNAGQAGNENIKEDSSSKIQKKLKETVERQKKKKTDKATASSTKETEETASSNAPYIDKVIFDELKRKLETIGHPNIYGEEGGQDGADGPKADLTKIEGEDSLDDFSHETGIVILEALEEVVSQIRHSSTKGDISQILRRVEDVSDSQREVGEMLIATNDEIKTDMKTLSERLTKQTSKLREELQKLDGILNSLTVSVSDMKRKQGTLENSLSSTSRDLTDSIRSSGSWGFWMFFMIFQVLFIVAFFFFNKYRDEKKKLI